MAAFGSSFSLSGRIDGSSLWVLVREMVVVEMLPGPKQMAQQMVYRL